MYRMFRMINLCMVFLFLITLPVAASSSVDTNYNSKEITSETIITEENLYDVIEYVGLEQNAFVKTDKTDVKSNIKTVGDLEKVIQKVNEIPKKIHETSEIEVIPSGDEVIVPDDASIQSYPVKTVHKDTNYSSYTIRYSASGKYYTEPYPPHNAYWMEAAGGNIVVQSYDFPLNVVIESIDSLTNNLYNSGTLNSYLRLDYDFTVGIYIGVDWGWLKINENDISGYTTFGTSYL